MIPFLRIYIFTTGGYCSAICSYPYHFCQKDLLERYNAILTESSYKQKCFWKWSFCVIFSRYERKTLQIFFFQLYKFMQLFHRNRFDLLLLSVDSAGLRFIPFFKICRKDLFSLSSVFLIGLFSSIVKKCGRLFLTFHMINPLLSIVWAHSLL